MKQVWLHAGLQKTGTSSLQDHLMRPGGPLSAAGVDWLPAAVGPGRAHHNAAWEAGQHKRFRTELPGLAALGTALAESTADRVLISSEDFSLIPAARLPVLAATLQGAQLRPVFCLRNPVDWAESLYAQACKKGKPGPFPDYAELLLGAGRLDFAGILQAWDNIFGSPAVLVYEHEPDMAAALDRILGLVPAATPPPRKNQSLNERFVLTSQEIIADVRAGRLLIGGRALPPTALDQVARAMLTVGPERPEFRGSAVFLDSEAAQDLLDRLAPMVGRLSRWADIPVSYRQLTATRRAPMPPTEQDMAFLMERLNGAVHLQELARNSL